MPICLRTGEPAELLDAEQFALLPVLSLVILLAKVVGTPAYVRLVEGYHNLLFLNDEGKVFLGHGKKVLGQPACCLFAPEERPSLCRAVVQAESGTKLFKKESKLLHSSGKSLSVELSTILFNADGSFVAPGSMASGKFALVLIHDVMVYRDQNDLLCKVLQVMSHETRTPLNAIIGFSHELVRNGSKLSEQTREMYARSVYDAGTDMLGLIEHHLDYLHTDQLELHERLVELDMLSLAVADLLEDLAEEKKVAVRCEDVPSGLQLYADKFLLHKALLYLVENAIKFNKRDGRVVIMFAVVEDAVELTVADIGMGIEVKDRHLIFLPHHVGEPLRAGGKGLGLSFAKKYIQAHSGTLTFVSELGEGTTFTARFPAARTRWKK